MLSTTPANLRMAVGIDRNLHRLARTDALELRFLEVGVDEDIVERHHIAEPLPGLDEVAGVDDTIGEDAFDRRAHRGEVEVALGLGQRGLQFDQLGAGFVLLRLCHLDVVARGVGSGLRRFHRGEALIAAGFRDFEGGARGKSLGAERLLTVEVEAGALQRSLGGNQLRLGLFGRAFHRGDLAADPLDGGLLGRDLRARDVDRDAVIAVVDPEDHVALADHDVVAGNDGRDVTGHPGAERGVVGAHIGVIGGDAKASDHNVIHAVAGRGEREQRADTHQDHSLALARFRRGAGGAPGGLPVAGFSVAGLPGASAERRSSATGERGESRGYLAREPAFSRIRWPGANDTCSLVSRRGHYGLPINLSLHGASTAQIGPSRRQSLNYH